MLKQELIEKISKYFKLTGYEAEKIFDDIFRVIMEGVKDDKIVDLHNFGEFIIKQNGSNKTVEFLPKQSLEDDLNSASLLRGFQVQSEGQSASLQGSSSLPGSGEQPHISEKIIIEPPAVEKHEEPVSAGEETLSSAETPQTSSYYKSSDIEEELKRKREAILNKLSATPSAEKKTSLHAENSAEKTQKETKEEAKESFSDYFSVLGTETPQGTSSEEQAPESSLEIPEEQSAETSHVESREEDRSSSEAQEKQEEREEERVIPPNVVELHKDIISNVPERQMASEVVASVAASQTQFAAEPMANGKPYYIWYKDSEPSPQETQTLSVEYELLYQAQKEAEYRSKLKIYVTSFILFFSFVLILLIFSPVIYKVFFNPQETAPVENVQEETTSEETSQQQNNTQQNPPPLTNTQTQETQQTPPSQENVTQPQTQVTQTPQTNVQQTPPQTNVQQEPPPQKNVEEPASQKQTETVPPSNTEGLTKNSLGWTDEKYRVIYIILDNNKFTIQESAWDSETKAAKRLSTVETLKIAGMTGNVVKADLGEKGVWYRARFGEFSSLEEARKKAIELREKERIKLHAMLLYFLLFA